MFIAKIWFEGSSIVNNFGCFWTLEQFHTWSVYHLYEANNY